jgi:branched-chain amino acid transport system ATP-binding protein
MTARTESVLSVQGLEVVYNDVLLVLRGVSLEVPADSIVAVLGSNGAGKTTLMRAITGLLPVHRGKITKGSVQFMGREIDREDAPSIIRSGIAQVMEGRRDFAEMAGHDVAGRDRGRLLAALSDPCRSVSGRASHARA